MSGRTKGRPNKAKGDQLVEGMSQLTMQSAKNTDIHSLYPVKPKRTAPAPGVPVKLISNLFKMCLRQNKPIYRFGLNVEMEEDKNKEQLEDKEDKTGEPKKARKLNNELLREIVNTAVKNWISREKPKDFSKNLEYNYIFDANGTNIYALFDMFANSKDVKQEFRVSLNLDRIVEGKLVKNPTFFRVILHRGTKLNIEDILNFCNGKAGGDISVIQECIKAVNVIMRGKIASIPSNVMTATNIFPFKKENQFTVSPGVILNKGYYMSARPSESGLVLVVANTSAPFHEEIDLIDLMRARFAVRDLNAPLRPDIIERLKKEVQNKQVEARHINYGTKDRPHYRKYRVSDIAGSSLDKFTLVDKATKQTSSVTIADYFKKEYNWTIKYPKLPCIVDKGRKLPIEVCHLIEKQRVVRKMDPDETSEIIKKTAVPPEQHFKMIGQHVEEIRKHSQPMQDFGLSFDPKPIEVEGRELPPISLIGGTKRDIRPRDGQYDVQRDRFFKPAIVVRWAMAYIVDEDVKRDLERNGPNELFGARFSELYCNEARSKGVSIQNCEKYLYLDVRQKNILQIKAILKNHFINLNKYKFDQCIIVLPKKCPDWVYRYLQFLEASVQEGRKAGEKWSRISCLKYTNYTSKIIQGRDNGRMFLANLWLKYNTKLGGINFVLKSDSASNMFLQDGYIFISVDVCHPAPGDKLIQSVAAVVGMWDLTNPNMSYCTRMRVQKKMRQDHSTIEQVGELGNLFGEILEVYRQKKKKFPNKIVVLRDGVSEGQYKIVLEYELGSVKAILSRIYSNAKLEPPKLSCLVVQKRHRVRFMRVQPAQGRRGPDYNIQPGTVVDSTVTHPTDFSFYLAPHKAIQGTSRAAHIYMIYDEIKFTQDQAQAMVHALSYLSPRCTKSTSIPTPVNLADLAAERGKNIVISWNDDNASKMSEDERLTKLNTFLSNMADTEYKNTLFYV